MKKILKIKRETLLYKSKVEYADYCVNYTEGCSHGCKFPCYAMMQKIRYGSIKDYADWIKPKIVENALELLDKEIPKLKNKIKTVHLCFTTDPFMYKQGEVREMTLKIIEKLNANGIKCTVLTKGIFPKQLADTRKYSKDNEYGITLISLDNEFRKKYEPGTAPYSSRVNALKYLHDNGLKTWISMEPYPTPNFVSQNLQNILETVKFVKKIVFGKLKYNKKVSEFDDHKIFFQQSADLVIKFCKKNRIEYHIKSGTQESDNVSTREIFSKKA